MTTMTAGGDWLAAVRADPLRNSIHEAYTQCSHALAADIPPAVLVTRLAHAAAMLEAAKVMATVRLQETERQRYAPRTP